MSVGVVSLAAGGAALTCAALSVASWRALLRTGNGMIAWLVVGFAILGVKNAVKSYRAFVDIPDSLLVESLFSLADLAAVILVAYPVVAGRWRA